MTLDRQHSLSCPALFNLQRTLLVVATSFFLVSAAPLRDEVRGADEVGQALLDARAEAEEGTELAARLASGGRSSIPSLFEALGRGRFDVFVGENGNSTRVVSASEHEALVEAFGRLAWTDVLAFLDDANEDFPDVATRLTALEILGAHGDEGDLATMLEWSRPQEGRRKVDRVVVGGFGQALEAILDRESVAAYELVKLYGAAHLSLVPTFLRELGARPAEQHVNALAEVLGRVPGADALVLTELGQLGKLMHHPIDEDARERARMFLDSSDSGLLVAAIVAAQQMGDTGAVTELVALLNHENPNVQKPALTALKSITDEQLGPDHEAWTEWYEEAQTWWEVRAPRLLDEVRDARASVASRAVLELSKHKFFRHELAGPVAFGLEHPEDEVVILTCASLGHLGSPLSARPLIELLSDSRLEVKRAALLALRRLTAADHGEEPQGWIDAGW